MEVIFSIIMTESLFYVVSIIQSMLKIKLHTYMQGAGTGGGQGRGQGGGQEGGGGAAYPHTLCQRGQGEGAEGAFRFSSGIFF